MDNNNTSTPNQTIRTLSHSFWKSILLIIAFVFVIVILFGLLVYLFIRGAQQLGMSTPVYIVIFVGISGIFAWLIKRLSDTVSGMSRVWFPEDEAPD